MLPNRYYVTTAIPYVNGRPHLGFALEAVQADVLARYHRQRGDDTRFLTGTDDNSLKNVLAAEAQGLPVRQQVHRPGSPWLLPVAKPSANASSQMQQPRGEQLPKSRLPFDSCSSRKNSPTAGFSFRTRVNAMATASLGAAIAKLQSRLPAARNGAHAEVPTHQASAAC